jgi:hypothetical protein
MLLLCQNLSATAGTNKCLDVAGSGTADGTKVQVWDCNGSPAQIWSRDESGALRPRGAPNSCLDVPAGNFVQGAFLQIWSCNETPAQRMNAVFVPVGEFRDGCKCRAAVECSALLYVQDSSESLMWRKAYLTRSLSTPY